MQLREHEARREVAESLSADETWPISSDQIEMSGVEHAT